MDRTVEKCRTVIGTYHLEAKSSGRWTGGRDGARAPATTFKLSLFTVIWVGDTRRRALNETRLEIEAAAAAVRGATDRLVGRSQ